MISTEQKLQMQIEDLKRRMRELERAIARPSLGAVSEGVDYAIFTFGCVKADDTSVDVYPGEVQHAGSYFTSAKTAVNVSGGTLANPRYICGLYLRGVSLTILPDALATKPIPNDTNFYFWISSWYYTSEGTLTRLRINLDNAIVIPNLWPV